MTIDLEGATLFDSHCHLDHGTWDDGVDAVIARARAAGVKEMVTIGGGESVAYARAAVERAQTDPDVYATVGIHPHDAKICDEAVYQAIEDLAADPKVVGIGEAGLDYHYDQSPRDVQQQVFRRFVQMCHQLNKPLVIHCRDAFDDCLAILEEERGRDLDIVIHCFTGAADEARRCLDLGCYVSIPGIVTFKRAGDIPEVARTVPQDRLMIETDSPYLAPMPKRGKRNEPAYLAHTAAFVAGLRGVSVADLARTTTANARRFYRLP